MPAGLPSRSARRLSNTPSRRPRQRRSECPSPCQSASFEPNACGASLSAANLNTRHSDQSSTVNTRTTITEKLSPRYSGNRKAIVAETPPTAHRQKRMPPRLQPISVAGWSIQLKDHPSTHGALEARGQHRNVRLTSQARCSRRLEHAAIRSRDWRPRCQVYGGVHAV